MARFEDFDRHERRVITEALEYAQSEFYDPGHTQEDRDALHDMIKEIGAENEKAEERQRDFMQPNVRPGVYMKTVPANSLAAPPDVTTKPPRKRSPSEDLTEEATPSSDARTAARSPWDVAPPKNRHGKAPTARSCSPANTPAFCTSNAPIAATFTPSAPSSLSEHTAARSAEAEHR